MINIAAVGDSITFGAHSSGGNTTYPGQLQIMLDTKYPGEYCVSNLGRSGATMQRPPHGDAPYTQTTQYQTLLANEKTWDIVVIMMGTNDAKDACGVPASFCNDKVNGSCCNWPHPGQTNWTQDCSDMQCPFVHDYTEFLTTVKGFNNNPKIFIAIPPPLMTGGSPGEPVKPYGMNQSIINNVLPDLIPKINAATGLAAPAIDVYGAMGGTQDLDCGYASELDNGFLCDHTCVSSEHDAKCGLQCDQQSCDPCHPNDVGYTVLAKAIMAGLGL
jgi:lysophospholipase L1-like esterase